MRFDRGDRGVSPAAVARTSTRTEVDTSATYRVANEFDGAAQLIDGALIEHLTRLEFGGPAAGRAHTARGDSLRAELERLTSELSQWSRASCEIAAALRATADRYADAELYAAARTA